jgi:hypothetical protein
MEFDILKMVPRNTNETKSKAVSAFPDTSQFTKNAIRKHYPELEHKLIRD